MGRLLREGWQIKRSLTLESRNASIDEIYQAGISAGALGGKLLGAGGGGFMLFFVPLERRQSLRDRLKKLLCIPFKFSNKGSHVVVYEPEEVYDRCWSENGMWFMPETPDVVLFCGGAGLRLRSVIGDAPKGMARLQGRPFLELLLQNCGGAVSGERFWLFDTREMQIRMHWAIANSVWISCIRKRQTHWELAARCARRQTGSPQTACS